MFNVRTRTFHKDYLLNNISKLTVGRSVVDGISGTGFGLSVTRTPPDFIGEPAVLPASTAGAMRIGMNGAEDLLGNGSSFPA